MAKLSAKQAKRIASIINSIECTYIIYRSDKLTCDKTAEDFNNAMRHDTLALYDEFGIVLPNTEKYLAEREANKQ